MMSTIHDARSNFDWGGPAACEGTDRQVGPAGSRSDKRLRHADSIENEIHTAERLHRKSHPAWDCVRRSLLSLRDPTALTGRSGHPQCSLATRSKTLCSAARRSPRHLPTCFRTRLRLAAKRIFIVLAACLIAIQAAAGEGPTTPAPRRLVIAFASHRERPAFANIYFYRHDSVGKGEPAGSIPALFERADSHPSLTSDGSTCAYASKQIGGFTPLVNLWSLTGSNSPPASEKGPAFNVDAGSRIEPCLSGDGKLLAFCVRGQAGSMGGWDVQLYNTAAGRLIELPGLNSEHDEREVSLSRDGRLLAFVTNRIGGAGLSDIGLYDRETATLVSLDELNSEHREINPSLSADGRFLAFVSDRPAGAGGKDIYLYDYVARRLVDLPGLNSVAHEQTPALSPDGRFIAFVSERTAGAGERDIFLYDRQTLRLVPTPGLNSKEEDFDPCLAYEGVPEGSGQP